MARKLQILGTLSGTGGQNVELDTTLTVEGKAADAKAVGDALSELSGQNVNKGWTTEQIDLLDQLFNHIPFKSDEGGDIADALIASLRSGSSGGEEEPDTPVTPEKTLTSISATYSGGDVAVGTAVTALTGVVVTAHYSDGTSEPVTGYTLSGTIAEGSNAITVTYQGMSATFTATGVAESGGEEEPEIPSVEIPADVTRLAYIESTGTQYIDTGYQPAAKDTIELAMETAYAGSAARVDWFGASDGTDNFMFGTNLTTAYWGRSGNNSRVSAPTSIEIFGESTDELRFTVRTSFDYNYAPVRALVSINVDGETVASTATSKTDAAIYNDVDANMYLFASNNNGAVQRQSAMKLYECIFYDENGTEKHHYVPVKDAEGVVCLYDAVDKRYLYNAGTGDFVGGETT